MSYIAVSKQDKMINIQWDITEKGLVLTADDEQREDLKELVLDQNILQAEGDALENATCNGLTYVLPEDVGALTDATILTDGERYFSDFNYYQVRSFVEDLIDKGTALLHDVTNKN